MSGSELLVKRHGGLVGWVFLGAGIGLLAIAAFFMSPGWRAPVATKFFGTFGAIFVAGGAVVVTTVFEFYEASLARRTLFGSTEARYHELAGFTFAEEIRHVRYGLVPVGRAAEIVFTTARGKNLRLAVASSRNLDDVYAVRDRIAAVMAEAWMPAVESGKEIGWAGARLSRHGLTVDNVTLPLRDGVDIAFGDFVVRITSRSDPSREIVLSTREPNFYPGLALLRRLTSGEKRGALL